ncbi:hypothetical protein PR202_gb02997 [Eleusine coracana subsp. coracana]|uniref:Uncharacterized protein n=1 Tax=Eleusine coracana subsp. coracana TaxID=191504 RepID=A0AAV5E0Q1_ELECO|nr:hypothetical protein PR202_gb02997 [Eleusine coracana subsp. coracana]
MGEAAAAPRPRSPPRYPDMCGRRRLQLEVQILNRELGFLEVETLHVLSMLVLQLLAQARDANLFLPRRAVLLASLQLPEHAVVLRGSLQPPQLRLQAALLSLPAPMRQLLFQRRRELPRLLLLLPMCRMRWLPRRPDAVPELPAAFLLQMSFVVLWRCPGGAAVSGVLMRLRVLLPQVQRRMPVPAVRWMLMLN